MANFVSNVKLVPNSPNIGMQAIINIIRILFSVSVFLLFRIMSVNTNPHGRNNKYEPTFPEYLYDSIIKNPNKTINKKLLNKLTNLN